MVHSYCVYIDIEYTSLLTSFDLLFMHYSILGTGMVGRAHAERLVELGHEVTLGTRDVEATLAQKEKDHMGNPPFSVWYSTHTKVQIARFSQAAQNGEVVINALRGDSAVSILSALAEELSGKVVIDIANPLDFSKGMPPTLTICNTDSLAEMIQRALPKTKVVKAFSTLAASVQVRPTLVAEGAHDLFVCGDDAEAKLVVQQLAGEYGWTRVMDLGDITSARGMEMFLPLWLRLWGALKTPMFNITVVS